MMKVLFVSEYFQPKIMGGGEINLFLMAKNLVKNGIEVHVITSFFIGLRRYEVVDGVHVHRRLQTGSTVDRVLDNFKRSFIFPISLKQEIPKLSAEINFDIVHFIGSSVIMSSICKKLRKTCVATVESYVGLCPKGDLTYKGKGVCNCRCNFATFVGCLLQSDEVGKTKNKWYLRFNPIFWIYVYTYNRKVRAGLDNCNIIAISEFIRNKLKQEGLQSIVIPNIVETEKFYSKKTKNKRMNVLYLGSLTKYKGPDVLLQAVIGLPCHVDLYGGGNLKNHLSNFIKKNKIDASIHAPVDYTKIPYVYAQTDIVVFPSVWAEPFGRIPVEAMAAGKPVIASDVGAIKEVVKGYGLLVPPANVRALRKAILQLMENDRLRESYSRKGKKYAQSYSKGIAIRKLIEYYSKIR